MVGEVNSGLESNPTPARGSRRAQTDRVHTRTQRPHGAEPELCLGVPRGGAGQHGTAAGQGLGVQQTWVWHRPPWRKMPLTPIELPELTQDWGTDSVGAQARPCERQDPGKGAVATEGTEPHLP